MATKKMHKKQGKRRASKKLASKNMGAVQTLSAHGGGGAGKDAL